MKKNILKIVDKILKNSKFVFPLILLVAVVITVLVALGASGTKEEKLQQLEGEVIESSETIVEEEPPVGDVPLTANGNTDIDLLIRKYFTALADGDIETLKSVCDVIEEDNQLEISELAKYVESYEDISIYTKPGLDEGTYVAYICYEMKFSSKDLGYPGYRTLYISKNIQGQMYLKFDLNDSENDYIVLVSSQADVVDMNNRIAVEYNDLMEEHPELLKYLSEVQNEVKIAMGVIYGQQASESIAEESTEVAEGTVAEGTENTEEQPVDVYATAVATVNVRSSDSTQSDKLGKATSGMKLQVLEQRVNGWSKVIFEGKEGFIKTEFLSFIESVKGQEVIGTITAVSNVNVRSAASESADRLGLLTGGDTADLLATENGWCKINYNGKVGYVKEEFVQK